VELRIGGGTGVGVADVAPQYAVDQQCEFACGSGDGGGLAGTRCQPPVKSAERSGGTHQAHRTAAQDRGRTISRGWGLGTEQAPAGDFVVGRQAKPGGEVLGAGPAVHIGANLGDELHGSMRADAIDLAQVSTAGQPVERGAEVEGRLVPFRLGGMARGGQLSGGRRLVGGQGVEQLLDSAIALGDLFAVELSRNMIWSKYFASVEVEQGQAKLLSALA
jgi:hypothetical protein